MSNDRHQDERVSAAYRSLADEKTPQHLDRKILQMAAAQAKRPSYSRWMAWSRPLAWAATITLCLAITLELAREPSLEPGLEPALESSDDLESTARKDEEAPLQKERARDMAASLANSIASEKTALGRSAASQPANVPAPAARRPSTDENVAAHAESYEVEEQKAKVVGEAFRYEDRSAAMRTSASVAADMSLEEITVTSDCPEIVQDDPETWLECILNLEDAGNQKAAEREREALIDTFPDFKMP